MNAVVAPQTLDDGDGLRSRAVSCRGDGRMGLVGVVDDLNVDGDGGAVAGEAGLGGDEGVTAAPDAEEVGAEINAEGFQLGFVPGESGALGGVELHNAIAAEEAGLGGDETGGEGEKADVDSIGNCVGVDGWFRAGGAIDTV